MPLVNRVVLGLLRSDVRPLLDGTVGVVRYVAGSGAPVVLPVQVARDGDLVVIMAGDAARKRWWRHFRQPAAVEVRLDGRWHGGTGQVVTGAGSAAAAAYRRAYPRATVPADATFVVVHCAEPVPERPPLRGRLLARAWFWTVTVAEFAGFAVPAVVGALTVDAAAPVTVAALLAAGAVEGSLLGWGQATVLHRALTGPPASLRRQWILATAGAAMLAYAIGLAPSSYARSMTSWPPVLQIAAAAVLGAALLGSIGTAQWLILRRHVARAARWIPATAVAWTVGLGAFLAFTMPLWQPGQPVGLTVAIGIAGGLIMAATTSAITGYALRRLLP